MAHCPDPPGSVSGFTAPGSPGVSGVLLPPSPTRGSLRHPDRSAIGSQSPVLQATSILVVDTLPSHSTPPPPPPPAHTQMFRQPTHNHKPPRVVQNWSALRCSKAKH